MTLDLSNPRTARVHAALGPYSQRVVEAAALHALKLHADEVGAEHLLGALMADEDAAAHRAVLRAFVDPDTIFVEALALSPGIMVVGSKSSKPFSVRGVRALEAARELAAARRELEVAPAHVLACAVDELRATERELLEQAGYDREACEAQMGEVVPLGFVTAQGPLFREFSQSARRVLARACRLAEEMDQEAISPAHLVLACAEVDRELLQRAGLPAMRVRLTLAGRDRDDTPLEARPVPAADELIALLEGLPAGASTLDVLASFLDRAPSELRQVLARNRVTAALIERSRAAFEDPSVPEEPA